MAGTPAVRDALTTAIAQARDQDSRLYLEAYCRASGCPAREVTIHVKDHDRNLVALIRRRGLVCSICGESLTLHHVQTARDHHRRERANARRLTNTQMYERDHMGPDGCCAVSLSVCGDDRLPPTPPDWWRRDG